jgi:glycosyltransferase involved in cell wall biosynthesis
MRVFVVEGSGKGGMIQYDYHLCRALQRTRVDTTLVTSTVYELDNLAHNFRVVKLLRLWDPRGSKTRNPIVRKARRAIRGIQYTLQWLRLMRFLRRERPDVVLFGKIHFPYEYYFLRMLRASGLKLADIVHDVRNYDTRPGSTAVVQDLDRQVAQYNRIYRLFDALFVHDRTNYDLFLNTYDVPAERLHVIPMATNELVLEVKPDRTCEDLQRAFNVKPDQPVVLFFGTVSRYKGVETLIEAFPAVQRATGARLVIAGFPAKEVDPDALKARAAELGVGDQVSWFLDYVPNERVVPLMELGSVAVFPYHAVSQSAAIQVAYACGKPVVATRVGGLGDIVDDGRSGLLVPPEDPAALGEAIVKILKDPVTAASMGQHAKMLAESKYAWRVVAEQMEPVFESLGRS